MGWEMPYYSMAHVRTCVYAWPMRTRMCIYCMLVCINRLNYKGQLF